MPWNASTSSCGPGCCCPPSCVGAHVGSPRAHTTGRAQDLSLRAATALFGHFGIEWDLTCASPDEVAELTGVVAAYTRMRGLLHSGRVHRVDHPDRSALVHGVIAKDGSEALYAYIQLEAGAFEVPPPVRLTGLDPDRVYRVDPVPLGTAPRAMQTSGPPWMDAGLTCTGRLLSAAGLQVPILAPEQALVLHLRDPAGHPHVTSARRLQGDIGGGDRGVGS